MEEPKVTTGELDSYILAVAQRKAIRRNPSTRVNWAILFQLEDRDLPLLLEIIRVLSDAVKDIAEGCEDEDCDGFTYANRALIRVEELAATGCKKKWGTEEDECRPRTG